MKRSATLAGIEIVIGLSCTPTEPCACSPPGDHAIVFGTLRAASGAAMPNGTIAADVGILGQCNFTGSGRSGAPATTNASGAYRISVGSYGQGPDQCVRVVGWAGAMGASDSIRSPGTIVRFRPTPVLPDSTRVDLVLSP